MIHINFDGYQPEQDWIDKAQQLTNQLLSAPGVSGKNSIIDSNESCWRELKDQLLELSHNKCWYSESKENYSYMHVDHFRPKKSAIGIDKKDKGGYWWLTFNWKNFRMCGAVGNVNKRDKFAVFRNKACKPSDNIDDEIVYLLDPTNVQDVLKLTFNSNGEIMPLNESGWKNKQAEYTITTLKLNVKMLKEARKSIWNKCYNIVKETQQLMDECDINPSSHKSAQIEEKLSRIKEMVNAESEFSATVKACLLSTGVDWVISVAS